MNEERDTDERLWHPWLRINRVLRAMLTTRWSAEAWPQVKAAEDDNFHAHPAGGRTVHARVQRIDEPASREIRFPARLAFTSPTVMVRRGGLR